VALRRGGGARFARSSTALASVAEVNPTVAGTILIVDDDRAVVDLLAEALGEVGYHVRIAFDGQMALEAVDRLATDLVVTDIRMPRMDGRDLVRRLRDRDRPIPVLVLTGAPDHEDDPEVPVLTKPFSIEEVVGMVDRLIARAGRN
jgi:CheY-like chemotaxis protein